MAWHSGSSKNLVGHISSTQWSRERRQNLQGPPPSQVLSSGRSLLLEFDNVPKKFYHVGCIQVFKHMSLWRTLLNYAPAPSQLRKFNIYQTSSSSYDVARGCDILALPAGSVAGLLNLWLRLPVSPWRQKSHLIIPWSPISTELLGLKFARGFSEIMVERFGDLCCSFRKYEVFLVITELAAALHFFFVFPSII